MEMVCYVTIPNKYMRDERWDVFTTSIQKLFNAYENAVSNPLTAQQFEDNLIAELEKKGARKVEAQLIAGKRPRYQLRGVTKTGFLTTKISVYEDGSIIIIEE
jgi:S-adenosylmethionine:tRNA-ribosyltransferase-isomerase (queuine synthetase)